MGVGDLKTRLYVKQDLNKGSQIILSKEQAHYLRNVLRLREGDNIALFNGRDGEWKTEIINIDKKNVLVCVNICSRPQEITADIWLIFAPIKGLRVDFVAQKATELGVNMLCPVFTEHTSVTRVNVERLLSNAIEAAEQSGRLSVPQIHSPVRLEKLIEKVINENQDKVKEYKSGKEKLFGFFVGQTMKVSDGKANPQLVNEILKKKLK